MIDLNAICPQCGEPYGKHRMVHPRPPRNAAPPQICPLCGGKMHRKARADTSEFECAWRQWASAVGLLDESHPPEDMGPRVTPELMLEFAEWRAAQGPGFEAGEVPASRILRQRARAAADAAQGSR